MPLFSFKFLAASSKAPQTPEFLLWKKRHTKLLITTAAIITIISLFTPSRYIIKTQGIAIPQNLHFISVKIEGQIEEIFVKTGQWVNTQTPLLKLSNSKVQAELTAAETDLQRSRLNFFELQSSSTWSDQSKITEAIEQFKATEAHYYSIKALADELVLKSSSPGYILTPDLQRLKGTFVTAGTPLLKVGDHTHLKLLIPLTEAEARQVELKSKVRGEWIATGKTFSTSIELLPQRKALFPEDYFEAAFTSFGGPAPRQTFATQEESLEKSYPIYIAEAPIAGENTFYREQMRVQVIIYGKKVLAFNRLKNFISKIL